MTTSTSPNPFLTGTPLAPLSPEQAKQQLQVVANVKWYNRLIVNEKTGQLEKKLFFQGTLEGAWRFLQGKESLASSRLIKLKALQLVKSLGKDWTHQQSNITLVKKLAHNAGLTKDKTLNLNAVIQKTASDALAGLPLPKETSDETNEIETAFNEALEKQEEVFKEDDPQHLRSSFSPEMLHLQARTAQAAQTALPQPPSDNTQTELPAADQSRGKQTVDEEGAGQQDNLGSEDEDSLQGSLQGESNFTKGDEQKERPAIPDQPAVAVASPTVDEGSVPSIAITILPDESPEAAGATAVQPPEQQKDVNANVPVRRVVKIDPKDKGRWLKLPSLSFMIKLGIGALVFLGGPAAYLGRSAGSSAPTPSPNPSTPFPPNTIELPPSPTPAPSPGAVGSVISLTPSPFLDLNASTAFNPPVTPWIPNTPPTEMPSLLPVGRPSPLINHIVRHIVTFTPPPNCTSLPNATQVNLPTIETAIEHGSDKTSADGQINATNAPFEQQSSAPATSTNETVNASPSTPEGPVVLPGLQPLPSATPTPTPSETPIPSDQAHSGSSTESGLNGMIKKVVAAGIICLSAIAATASRLRIKRTPLLSTTPRLLSNRPSPAPSSGPLQRPDPQQFAEMIGENEYPQDLKERLININRNWARLETAKFTPDELMRAARYLTYVDSRGVFQEGNKEMIYDFFSQCQQARIVYTDSPIMEEYPIMNNCVEFHCQGSTTLRKLPIPRHGMEIIDCTNCPQLELTTIDGWMLGSDIKKVYCDSRVSKAIAARGEQGLTKINFPNHPDWDIWVPEGEAAKLTVSREDLIKLPFRVLRQFEEAWLQSKKMPIIKFKDQTGRDHDAFTSDIGRYLEHIATLQKEFIMRIVHQVTLHAADSYDQDKFLQGLGIVRDKLDKTFHFRLLTQPSIAPFQLDYQIEGLKALGIIFAQCWSSPSGKEISYDSKVWHIDKTEYRIGGQFPPSLFKAIHCLTEEDFKRILNDYQVPEDISWKILLAMEDNTAKKINSGDLATIEATLATGRVDKKGKATLATSLEDKKEEATLPQTAADRLTQAMSLYIESNKYFGDPIAPIVILAKQMYETLCEIVGSDAWQTLRKQKVDHLCRQVQGEIDAEQLISRLWFQKEEKITEAERLRIQTYVTTWIREKAQHDPVKVEQLLFMLTGSLAVPQEEFITIQVVKMDPQRLPNLEGCVKYMMVPPYSDQSTFNGKIEKTLEYVTASNTTGFDIADNKAFEITKQAAINFQASEKAAKENALFQSVLDGNLSGLNQFRSFQFYKDPNIRNPPKLGDTPRVYWNMKLVETCIQFLLTQDKVWNQEKYKKTFLHFLINLYQDTDQYTRARIQRTRQEQEYINHCNQLFEELSKTPQFNDRIASLIPVQGPFPATDPEWALYLSCMCEWPSAVQSAKISQAFVAMSETLKTPDIDHHQLANFLYLVKSLMKSPGSKDWDPQMFGIFVSALIEYTSVWTIPQQAKKQDTANQQICQFFVQLLDKDTPLQLRQKSDEILISQLNQLKANIGQIQKYGAPAIYHKCQQLYQQYQPVKPQSPTTGSSSAVVKAE